MNKPLVSKNTTVLIQGPVIVYLYIKISSLSISIRDFQCSFASLVDALRCESECG